MGEHIFALHLATVEKKKKDEKSLSFLHFPLNFAEMSLFSLSLSLSCVCEKSGDFVAH